MYGVTMKFMFRKITLQLPTASSCTVSSVFGYKYSFTRLLDYFLNCSTCVYNGFNFYRSLEK
jgi:hypothetical protein